MNKLPWFPPAPSPGPLSMLELSPDDWLIQPKVDGVRVILCRAGIFTRHGTPLTKGKGLASRQQWRSRQRERGAHPRLEGEWVQRTGKLWLFDMPEHHGTFDERIVTLGYVADKFGNDVLPMPHALTNFPQAYRDWRIAGHEGVVMKRRNSRYIKQSRPGTEIRDWVKRRYSWDAK